MSNLFERIATHKLEHTALSKEMVAFAERQIKLTEKAYKQVFGRDTDMYVYDYLTSDNDLVFVGCMKYGGHCDGDWSSATVYLHPLVVAGKDDEYFDFCVVDYTSQKEAAMTYTETLRQKKIKELIEELAELTK